MRIFITGIAGFLGSHLAEEMLKLGHEVSGCDNLIGGDEDNIPKGVDWCYADCKDARAMSLLIKDMDIVYHCAATAHEGVSVFSPSFITDNIYAASVSVFSAAIANNVKRIIFCSSMARYGPGYDFKYREELFHNGPPFEEHYKTNPQDPYGIAKVAAEETLKMLCETHNVEYVIAVPHNIYGPKQKFDDPYRNVASIMINRMLQGNAPIIYGDGSQTRCFSYIDDCLSCLVKMIDAPISGEIINIGPDEGAVTIKELAELLIKLTGFPGEPEYFPDRPCEVKHAACSSDKARRLLDYKTSTTLRDGMKALVYWIEKHGPKEFKYDFMPKEIITERTPKTWTDRLI